MVEEAETFEANERKDIDVFASKLLGWYEEEDFEKGNTFLGWLRDEAPFVIGSNYRCCLLVNANGEVVTEYL